MIAIHHVTINTGHTRPSPRDEVADTAINTCAIMLCAALETGRPVLFPGREMEDYRLTAMAVDQALLATVSADPAGLTPLITMGVAIGDESGVRLWDMMLRTAQSTCSKPETPYIGVILWPATRAHPDALPWLGDFERCLAWAWFDLVAGAV